MEADALADLLVASDGLVPSSLVHSPEPLLGLSFEAVTPAIRWVFQRSAWRGRRAAVDSAMASTVPPLSYPVKMVTGFGPCAEPS